MMVRVTNNDSPGICVLKRRFALKHAILGAGFGVMALVVTLVFVEARQPRYEGKPIRYWIEQLTGDDLDKAHEALLAIGEPAIPALLDAVKTEPSPGRSQLLENMSDVPLLGRVAEKLAERRNRREQIPEAAAEFLANMRNHATTFVPQLVRIYQDPKRSEEVINRAAEVLAEFGPDAGSAMPSFLAHLRGTDVTHKPLTVSILSAIGPPAREAVPLLTNLFNGEGPNDLVVAEALWTIDRRTNETVTACLQILQAPPPRFNEAFAR